LDLYIPYTPFEYQEKFEKAMKTRKRAVLCWARRHGKDYACWNYLIMEALEKKGTYFYVFPQFAQARKAIWDAISEKGLNYLDLIPNEVIAKKLTQEMKIHLVNGSIIQFLGSDRFDVLRGTNPCGVILSEYAYQNPNVWTLVLDPILAKNKGWAIFNSTPNAKNHFFDLYNYAMENPEEWYVSKVTNEDTGFVDQKELDKKITQGMSPEFIEQEYNCSFEVGVVGSYYGRCLRDAEKDGRVGHVPYDANCLVYTAWDLGFSDQMVILFYQKRGNEILIIDYYENQGYQLAHYLNILRQKDYVYGKHYAPHDAKAHDRTGNTFIQIAREQGFDFEVLPNSYSVLEGIEKVRGMFPRMFFDKVKCEYLLRCLLEYHADYDQKLHIYKNVPKHNWASHAADSLRYLVYSLYEMNSLGMTKEELRELKRQNNYYQ